MLKNKEIFLFFNIEEKPLSLKYLLSLNIKGLMRTSNDDYGLYKKRKDYKRLNILQKLYLDRLPKYPKHLNDFMYLGNGGLISIVYMINYFKPKRVLLFGFNFYQSKMISNSSFSNSVNEDSTVLRKAGAKLIQNFIHICNLFNNIEFQRYDDTQIEMSQTLNKLILDFRHRLNLFYLTFAPKNSILYKNKYCTKHPTKYNKCNKPKVSKSWSWFFWCV